MSQHFFLCFSEHGFTSDGRSQDLEGFETCWYFVLFFFSLLLVVSNVSLVLKFGRVFAYAAIGICLAMS